MNVGIITQKLWACLIDLTKKNKTNKNNNNNNSNNNNNTYKKKADSLWIRTLNIYRNKKKTFYLYLHVAVFDNFTQFNRGKRGF